MKRYLLLVLVLVSTTFVVSAAQAREPIPWGIWTSVEGDADIRILYKEEDPINGQSMLSWRISNQSSQNMVIDIVVGLSRRQIQLGPKTYQHRNRALDQVLGGKEPPVARIVRKQVVTEGEKQPEMQKEQPPRPRPPLPTMAQGTKSTAKNVPCLEGHDVYINSCFCPDGTEPSFGKLTKVCFRPKPQQQTNEKPTVMLNAKTDLPNATTLPETRITNRQPPRQRRSTVARLTSCLRGRCRN